MPKPILHPFMEREPGQLTIAQENFLEDLFADIGFTISQRNDWISRRVGRKCRAIDELKVREASELIQELVDQRDRNR